MYKRQVLDEPLNGVDPVGCEELNDLFRSLAAQGKAVLVSSHILHEMDQLADRILFICQGKLLASGSLEEIRDMLDDHPLKVRISCGSPRRIAPQLLTFESVKAVSIEPPSELLLEVQNPGRFYAEFGEFAAGVGLREWGTAPRFKIGSRNSLSAGDSPSGR